MVSIRRLRRLLDPRRRGPRRLDQRRQSVLGADLDSLADVISFGVAPAVLGFTLGLRGGWDMVILTYFVVCGVSRLARFNATTEALTDVETGKVRYFEGTPIPTSVVLVLVLGSRTTKRRTTQIDSKLAAPPTTAPQFHDYLLLSTRDATMVLDASSSDELQEVTDRVEFECAAPTIAAGTLSPEASPTAITVRVSSMRITCICFFEASELACANSNNRFEVAFRLMISSRVD